jgi:caffeoyl-CoA O-methyltransferase
MSSKTFIPEKLYEYVLKYSARESKILQRLRKETATLPQAQMQISADQGKFMQQVVQMIGAVNTLEVGVFTGYSSLAVALVLPPQGTVVACDISKEYTDIARRYWEEAGVSQKIDLRLAPAAETLQKLVRDKYTRAFDFAFIDADKKNLQQYFDVCLQLLRPRGVIAIDNTLWSGKVIDKSVTDEDTRAIRAFNKKLATDNRVFISMLPIGDGLTLAMKR